MPKTLGLNRSLGGAIAAIAAVSLLSSGVVFATLRKFDAATEARSRSNRIIRDLDAFRTAMLNQETGLRGFLLTGDPVSLGPYTLGRPALDRVLSDIKPLVSDIANEAAPLAEAEAAARRWQAEIGEPAARMMADPANRTAAMQLETSGAGRQLFDQFRARLQTIETAESEVLARQSRSVADAARNSLVALLLGTLVTLLICGGIGIAINRLIVTPVLALADAMRRLARRDLAVAIPGTGGRSEIGAMARAVEVFKRGLIELDRTSLLRATADTLPALVGYVDTGRRIGFLNAEFARWFELGEGDVSEVYGRPLAQVFGPAGFPGASQELEAAFAGEDLRFEHRLSRRGARRRDLEAVYRPHRGPDGIVLGVVTLLTDITDRKQMDRRLAQQTRDLRRSNEELEQFAYVASHDLKAPLRGIENLVSWIEEDLEGALSGDTRTNMDLLKSRVRRLESLLDDLLAYSRAGRTQEDDVTVDTRALVHDLAALVSPPAGFSIVAEPSLPTIETPRAPLTQVLQNLIGNAIKHHDHPADGHVWVDAAPGPEGTTVTVTDDGPGIPERFHDRVFGMFQTLRPRDEVEGSGMGLAIVKKLVEHRGGRIWLTPGRGGRGLSVHFTWGEAGQGKHDGADGQFAAG